MEREFRIGDIISKAWDIYMANFAVFTTLVLIANVPVLLYFVTGTFLDHGDIFTSSFGLVNLLTFFVAPFVQAVLIHGTIQGLRGRQANLAAALEIARTRFFTLFAIAVVQFVLILGGMMLLLVPGFMAATALFVSVPACVIEGKGVMESFRRSLEIVTGYRWRILGLLVALGVIHTGVNFVLGIVFAESIKASLLASSVLGIVFAALMGAVVSVTYYQLRSLNEDTEIDEIAAIFD